MPKKQETPQPVAGGKTIIFSYDQLRKRYENATAACIARCRLVTEMVGGVPADEAGVRAFVRHHLQTHPFVPRPGIEKPETEDEAVARIMREELGERPVPSETGELQEKLTYGVKVIRRDSFGPYIGSWMLKACLKNSASRLKIFQEKRGTKGDMAELGLIEPWGISKRSPDQDPLKVYLIDEKDDKKPARTSFREFSGRVQTPQGSASIQHDSEIAPVGTRFEFIYRLGDEKLTASDVADIFSVGMVVGVGSVKALECGKFAIEQLTFTSSDRKDKRSERNGDGPEKK